VSDTPVTSTVTTRMHAAPSAPPLRALLACAEIFPLLKTGGLADVAGALPGALAAAGADARVLLPGFAAISSALEDAVDLGELHPRGALGTVRLRRGRLRAVPAGAQDARGLVAYVIDAPHLYHRPGGPYADADQRAWDDNAQRFAWLGWAAAELAAGRDPDWTPQLVHGHDWHAGLVPLCLRLQGVAAASVFTIHNLAYQGAFDPGLLPVLGIPPQHFHPEGLEFHGALNFMKAGLFYADQITTVSPSYAREIRGAEQGMGMDGLLRARGHRLHGILNGVDPAVWNPATDALIAHRYDAAHLAAKDRNRAELRAALGLDADAAGPLFTIVSRLADQKGLPLVQQVLPALLSRGGQFALLGSGDAGMEQWFRDLAARHPGQVAVRIGYDEAHAHRLVAGADVIMVPSRFEPCGLTQLYGLTYGTLPLVRRVGGLADTVTDCTLEALDEDRATGFVFDDYHPDALDAAVRRAFVLHRRRKDWRQVQRRAMAQRHDWGVAADATVGVYRQALHERGG